MQIDSGPDEMNVDKTPFAESRFSVLKDLPIFNDPNVKEYIKQMSKHPSNDLVNQQLRNLFSPATENSAPEFDQHAFASAKEQILQTPHVSEALGKCPPLPKEILTIFYNLPAVKRLADNAKYPVTMTSYMSDKNVLRELGEALLTMANDVKADESDNEEGAPILHIKAELGDVKGLNEVLQGGADINEKDYLGRTALEIACAYGKVEFAKILIERGADVKLTDDNGNTALHYAVTYGKRRCVKLLLEHDAILTYRNKDGIAPIDLATSYLSHKPKHRDVILKMFNHQLCQV